MIGAIASTVWLRSPPASWNAITSPSLAFSAALMIASVPGRFQSPVSTENIVPTMPSLAALARRCRSFHDQYGGR